MPFRVVSSLLLSSLTIVNEGSSLTILEETASFIQRSFCKAIVFKKLIVLFLFSCHSFHNETIVFLKNENVNIPSCNVAFYFELINHSSCRIWGCCIFPQCVQWFRGGSVKCVQWFRGGSVSNISNSN